MISTKSHPNEKENFNKKKINELIAEYKLSVVSKLFFFTALHVSLVT